MHKLSVYILAYNEAEKIAAAVESVAWADEVLVIDSGSTDETAAIAERLGARVVNIPFTGFGALRNQAVAACSHEWVFSLDADERCTPAARAEIERVLAAPDADAYFVPRRNWFLGRWIKHGGWYPDFRQPQLFRKGALVYAEEDEVHEGYRIRGKTARLAADIWQMPFADLGQVLAKGNRYSSLGAEKLARLGVRGSMAKALAHALAAFFRIYVLKLGFLDGWAGFVIALGNFEGTFYRYAKLTERQRRWNAPPPAA